MLNKNELRDYIQNKNFVMFTSSIILMIGILACFTATGIPVAIIFTLLLICLMYLKIISIRKTIIWILIFYFGFFLTFFRIKVHDDLLPLAPLNSTFQGQIVSIPNSTDKTKIKFFMNVEKESKRSVHGKTLVTISDTAQNLDKLNIGDKITIKGNLREPFKSTNPSQFDYSKYLRNFNAFTVLYVEAGNFEILDSKLSLKWKFLQKLNKTRKQILETHSKYLQSPNLEILGGIVFGDDAIAPPEYIKNSFINSGLLHILAASGMNVAFIFSFWFFILKFLGIPYKPRVISGIFIIILYTLMTGLGPSVVRAAAMLIFVLIGKLFDRDAHSVALLSLVAVIMLVYNPAYINDVSFQLSFLVTLGLLTTANIISTKIPKFPNIIKAAILIPIVAQVWVAPIQMFYFNSFSLYSILANISTVCLLSIISFCGFISSIIATIPPLADFACFTFDFWNNYLLDLLVLISNFYGNLPNSIIQTTHPNIWQLIIYYVTLLVITTMIKFERYKQAIITTVCVSLLLICTTLKPISKDLEIITFDVQNADSFLIKTPENKYYMIDTGKAPYKSGNSQAKIIMLKYLKDNGIKNLEGVIVTHFDNDHSGGVPDIISNIKVKTLYLNSTEKETQTAKNIFETSKDVKQNIVVATNNNTIYNEPNLRIKTFKANITGKDKSNGCSIITLLSYKDFDILFMGDAGYDSFDKVKQNIPNDIEILKVGHHGGPKVINTKMVEHIGNKISLISTGINYFGHPNKGTLDILRNTHIYRTDLHHSIKISTNGEDYKIYTYDTNSKRYKFIEKFNAK